MCLRWVSRAWYSLRVGWRCSFTWFTSFFDLDTKLKTELPLVIIQLLIYFPLLSLRSPSLTYNLNHTSYILFAGNQNTVEFSFSLPQLCREKTRVRLRNVSLFLQLLLRILNIFLISRFFFFFYFNIKILFQHFVFPRVRPQGTRTPAADRGEAWGWPGWPLGRAPLLLRGPLACRHSHSFA